MTATRFVQEKIKEIPHPKEKTKTVVTFKMPACKVSRSNNRDISLESLVAWNSVVNDVLG